MEYYYKPVNRSENTFVVLKGSVLLPDHGKKISKQSETVRGWCSAINQQGCEINYRRIIIVIFYSNKSRIFNISAIIVLLSG